MDKNKRKQCIDEERCFVKVKNKFTKDEITAAMCPGCWNIKARREKLLDQLESKGYFPVNKNDKLDGIYLDGKKHSPKCPYNDLR